MSKLPQNLKVLRELQHGSASAQALSLRLDIPFKSISPIISRLRARGYKIITTSDIRLDPRYELFAGPGHMQGSFECPRCKRSIRLDSPEGAREEHTFSCPLR